MHFYPILLVQADSLEEAKQKARDFCETESGEHSYFEYGGVVEYSEWNKPLVEVWDKLPAINTIEAVEAFLSRAGREFENEEYSQAGYSYRIAGMLLGELFCTEHPLFNIQYYDYSRDYGDGWYAVETDFRY
jgi:hypothetical protein